MWVLLEEGDELLPGDKFLSGHGGWTGRVRSGEMYLRNLSGWAAVTHALKAEVLGNNKEGCETIPWMWKCECDKDFLHVYSEFPKCNKCGAWDSDQPNARKAEVILEIIEEK